MRRISFLLTLLLCLALPAAAEDGPERFEGEIQQLEARPALPGGTLFLGSSTWTLWGHDLETTFSEFGAVNRGFGGSTLRDIDFYLERLLLPQHPRLVVVYGGTNDLAAGRSADQVAADFQALVAHARRLQPGVHLLFVSASVAPSRWALRDSFARLNLTVHEWLRDQPDLGYVDVGRLVQDGTGHPRRELFREDQLHMTPAGYALWTPVLRAALARWWKRHPLKGQSAAILPVRT